MSRTKDPDFSCDHEWPERHLPPRVPAARPAVHAVLGPASIAPGGRVPAARAVGSSAA